MMDNSVNGTPDQQAERVVLASRCAVIFSSKGGVGKSVLAVNAAIALAQQIKNKVCVVDLDITAAGDVARIMGVQVPTSLVDTLHSVTQRKIPRLLLDDIRVTHASGVDLYQAISHPRQVKELTPAVMQAFFTELRSRYEYIIVDTKILTDALAHTFNHANLVLLVATPDVLSLYQTKWASAMIEGYLLPPHLLKVVLNRAQSRGAVASNDARLAINIDIIAEIPSDGRLMGSAVNTGTPVVISNSSAKISESFKDLAKTLIQKSYLFLEHKGIGATNDPSVSSMFNGQGPVNFESLQESLVELQQIKQRVHSRLVEELNLKHVDIQILSDPSRMQEMRKRCEQVIARLLAEELGGVIANQEQRDWMVREITDEALGLGPLEDLLADPTVNDILVNNKDQIYIERQGRLELTNKRFISDQQLRSIIERIVAPLGRRIDESTPMVDARLPDGSRVNAIIPPLSLKGSVISIRKFSQKKFTYEDLIKFGSINEDIVRFLEASVRCRKNIIVSGGTGSGKTTFLNIVSNFIPDNERIVTIEDAAELRLNKEHWVSLESRPPNVEGKGEVTIRDLFRNTLRMRPDRIVIGECRGGESLDMLQAMNTGHDGSITTIHANSPKDVISRLDSMVLMSGIELPIDAIREMVAAAIDVIVHTARLSDGTRKIISVSEIVGIEGRSDIRFSEIYRYVQTGLLSDGTVEGYFTPTGVLPSYMQELKVKGLGIDESMFLGGQKTIKRV